MFLAASGHSLVHSIKSGTVSVMGRDRVAIGRDVHFSDAVILQVPNQLNSKKAPAGVAFLSRDGLTNGSVSRCGRNSTGFFLPFVKCMNQAISPESQASTYPGGVDQSPW